MRNYDIILRVYQDLWLFLWLDYSRRHHRACFGNPLFSAATNGDATRRFDATVIT